MNEASRAAGCAAGIAACLFLTGCFGRSDIVQPGAPDAEVSRAQTEGLPGAATPAALDSQMEDGTQSELIESLLNRRSVVTGGPMRAVADAVMAANSRAAEADLRAAMLRAEARASNWLPSLGPQISVSSLGAVVTSILVEQVLFDNGARRAERDYAKHDVEVAAAALAEDSNTRVLQALELYLTAEAARARAAVNAAGTERMEHFTYVMRERVNAGISDRADLQVVQQRHNQMMSDMQADREAAAAAINELQAMSAMPVDAITGLSPLAAPSPTATALTVLKAQAESARAVAGARAARAGHLPGLSVGGRVGSDDSDVGLVAAAPNGLGFGTGASLRAIEAEEAAAAARVGQEREAAQRAIAALQGQLVALQRQEAQARILADQAGQNYDLFAEQQRAGQRSVTDVVGVFETKIRAERAAVELRYEIVRVELRIAARMGTLVDGEQM